MSAACSLEDRGKKAAEAEPTEANAERIRLALKLTQAGRTEEALDVLSGIESPEGSASGEEKTLLEAVRSELRNGATGKAARTLESLLSAAENSPAW